MALARPQDAGGAATLKAALIVMVCVTVASLAFMIIVYTGRDDLQAQVSGTQQNLDRANDQVRALETKLADFALKVIGDSTDDPAKIQQAIEAELKTVLADPRVQQSNIKEESAVVTALRGLYDLFVRQADELVRVTAERDGLSSKLTELTRTAEQRAKEFSQKAEDLETRFRSLQQQSEADRQAWSKQVEEFRQRLDASSASAGNQLNEERKQRLQAEEKLAEVEKVNRELLAQLRSFKPSADLRSVLQIADGSVVRAVAGQDIIYIGLGRRERVQPGMTFAVYSRVRGIPPDGKGKASLEVLNVFETTSECKISSSTPGDPILEGDVVANPVFDRSRRLNFAVAGDFDLDFDGKIDDPGGEKVSSLITGWGGNVVPTIDTRTDFLVAGAAPAAVRISADADKDLTSAELQKEQEARRKVFDAKLAEAKSLSIPILTRTEFLHFIGFGVPAGAAASGTGAEQPALAADGK